MATKYKGVYKNSSNGKYYFATKIKDENGNFKSIKSKSIYDTPIQCYSDLIKLKDVQSVKEEVKTDPVDYTPKIKPQARLGTSFEDVANQWLETYTLKNKEGTSYQAKQRLQKYILPLYNNLSINFACESRSLIEFKKYLKNMPCGNAYRNALIGIFTNIMQFAFYSNFISQQELGLVKLTLVPFSENSEVAPSKRKKREKFFYTLEEFNRFINVVKDFKMNTIYQVLFYGGLRIGELLALQVSDFDYNTRTLKVSKTINIKGNTTTPKTINGVRNVYLKKSVCDTLKSFIEGNNLSGSDILFKISSSSIRRITEAYSDMLDLDYLNPHGFRHSCCSMLFETYKKHNIAIDFKQVADYLGDKVDTILDVYYHLYGDENTRIIDLLD